MSNEFSHDVIYIFVSEIDVKSAEGKKHFPNSKIKNKIMRAIKVASVDEPEKKFYKVVIDQIDNPNKIVGFIVKDLDFENENIFIEAQELKIEELANYDYIEPEDYLLISKWEKTGNLDLYKKLFKETSNAIANSVCPYFLFPDEEELDEEYEVMEEEEYIQERVKEAMEDILAYEDNFVMYEIMRKVKEINDLDKNKLSALHNMIMYL